MLGMHWGTVVLSLEPIMEPAKDLKIQLNNLASTQTKQLFLKSDK